MACFNDQLDRKQIVDRVKVAMHIIKEAPAEEHTLEQRLLVEEGLYLMEKLTERNYKKLADLAAEQYQAILFLCGLASHEAVGFENSKPEYCDNFGISLIGGRKVWAPRGFLGIWESFQKNVGVSETLKNIISDPSINIEREIASSITRNEIFDGYTPFLARVNTLTHIAFAIFSCEGQK